MNTTTLTSPLLFAIALLVSASAIGADRNEWRYTIRPGDTLSHIAEKYLDRPDAWRTVQKLNQVADPDRLRPGRVLRMPYALSGRVAVFAEVVWAQGDVRRAHGATPTSLAQGAQLRMGDTVLTGLDSSVTLRFPDQSRLLISANSRITLTHLVRNRQSSQSESQIALDFGTAESIVTPRQKVEARYEIKTPALSLAVRGTRFQVAVDSRTGTTRTTVSEGTVEAAAKGKMVTLTEGMGTIAARGAAPSAPRELLQAPNLDAPSALLETLPIRFSWQPLPGVQQYRIELLDRAGQTQLGELLTAATAASWADLPDGEYQLRVRGVDSAGLEGRAAIHAFALRARPEPPLLRLPVAGSSVAGDKVAFRWARPQGTLHYRFQVSDSATFARTITQFSQLPASSRGIDLRLPPGRYFWRVAAAKQDADFGPNSDPQSFEVSNGGESAAGTLDSAGLVVVRWKAGQAGQRYQVQAALDPDFRAPILDTEQAGTEAIFPQRGSGLYFVRIRRIEVDGLPGVFEPSQQFIIAPSS